MDGRRGPWRRTLIKPGQIRLVQATLMCARPGCQSSVMVLRNDSTFTIAELAETALECRFVDSEDGILCPSCAAKAQKSEASNE